MSPTPRTLLAIADSQLDGTSALLSPGALPTLPADELGRCVLSGSLGDALACVSRDSRPEIPADRSVLALPPDLFARLCEANQVDLGELEMRRATARDVLAYTPTNVLLQALVAPVALAIAIALAVNALMADTGSAWLATGVFMLAGAGALAAFWKSIQAVVRPGG